MAPEVQLQPTIWRTCRVLANRRRLRLFCHVNQHPGETVSEIAASLNLTLSVTSQSLRALEARGLLVSQRQGPTVRYKTGNEGPQGIARRLVRVLRQIFQENPKPVDTVFDVATAFTHPRRVAIFRALQAGPRGTAQLRSATNISVMALRRHLAKLKARNFVVSRRKNGEISYAAAKRSDALGTELARIAAE
jgi:DNA-binding transcriptional ArsR family regulator